MLRPFYCSCAALLALVSPVIAGDIGFVEEFALAKDRAAALRQLIPGTEDYYYYHALNYLNTEQFAQAEALFKPWHERFNQTPRLTEIQTRHALLTYDANPQKTLQFLRNRLGLQFNHQKFVADGPLNLPTALDQQLFARATLKKMSLARWGNLDNFETRAMEWLAAENFVNWQLRRNLLQRLERPDVANLPSLIAGDLEHPTSSGFGSLPIHHQLTLAQLDELVKLRPDLLNQNSYVRTMLVKLQPGADDDWRHDPARTRAYLDRLLAFVRRLNATYNALKAHVLYHRLVLDRSQGIYDQALFIEYLKLPRQQPYMARALVEAPDSQRYPADLNADFSGATMLPRIGSDEPLVRSYLKHFFATAASPKPFEAFINGDYLKHLFAETKIELGLGDGDQWAAQLPPDMFRQLKERIDIDFDPTNKTTFAADEPVTLDLHVKNVPTLIVKVFEINTAGYYREHKKEVDTDITLDGLVANEEQTHTFTDPPLRRTPRRFAFPKLNKAGLYVIDFIGAGKSSRALVRKGRLRPLFGTSTAGQTIRVVDEANHPVTDAAVWLGGTEYPADADGVVTVPFSTSPGRQPIVIRRGDFASLDFLVLNAENFALTAGIYVDREALLAQRVAAVLVRPGLTLDGQPVAVRLLEDVKLRIVATDSDGIATSTEVPDFKLFEDRESLHEFRVPGRLAQLSVTLTAKVKSLSLNKSIDLAATQSFELNGIDKTEKIEDLHLAKFAGDYVVEVRGRSGEPRADRPVQVALKHRDFKENVTVLLKSDARGRVVLGPLADIVRVTATGPEGTAHNWTLPEDKFTYRQEVHAKAGTPIALPYVGPGSTPSSAELALFEVRGDVIRADRFDALAIHDGMLELTGLAAGDYDLWLKRTREQIRVRVVDGTIDGRYVLGQVRQLELPLLKPVQIAGITAAGDAVTIRLRDASPFTRVHVYATRYRPAYSAFGDLGKVGDAELSGAFPATAESTYLTGRNIGDEYRYVLDRKYQKKYAGNMLERPSLLLNPWAMRSTETNEAHAQGGDEFGPRGTPPPGQPMTPAPASESSPTPGSAGEFANLDFLADATAAVLNAVPDKDGVVKLTRKDVEPHAWIHVVAVDPLNTTSRWAALPEVPAGMLDLRLRSGLDPKKDFTQQKQVSVLPADRPFVLADVAAGRFEVYDSLPKVYRLYSTLSTDPKFAEFAFLMTWPTLKPEQKRAQFSKYACHELNFFLAKKDPEFFKSVVQPYLANKKDKTFLDHHAYQPTLWSFSIFHNDPATSREYLRHFDDLAAQCGGPLDSPLLVVDPVARYTYEHLEYKPLVNARAHALGAHRQIVNESLLAQYHRYLHMLTYRKTLTDADDLTVVYYLLLQDRVEEALATFAQVNPAQLATRMQYDYCAAWLDLCGDDPLKARPIAVKYASHPVDRWRNAFAAVASQLDEIEGRAGKPGDMDNQALRQGQLAAKSPGFELTLDGKTVTLTYQNVETVRVNYYLMDVELLFSRNPFVQQTGGQFASIRPNATQVVTLPAGKDKYAFTLPDRLATRNVLVEVTAGGLTRSLPYYANAMSVQFAEAYGQLRATDGATGKPLAKVYVKTYVRLADGTVKFHKDGYTDHRGRFDYASVSGPENQPAQRFAVLVLSDDHGAQIREAAPPQQ